MVSLEDGTWAAFGSLMFEFGPKGRRFDRLSRLIVPNKAFTFLIKIRPLYIWREKIFNRAGFPFFNLCWVQGQF